MTLLTQYVQFACFLTSHEGVRADSLYERLIGHEPDSVVRNKVPTVGNPLLSQATGQVFDLGVSCAVQPGRIDLSVFHPKRDDINEQGVPLIEFDEALHFLRDKLVAGIEALPVAIRLAVVSAVTNPRSSLAECCADLLDWTGMDIPNEGLSDLAFSINRRMALPRNGVEINRLMRYGCHFQQTMQIGPDGVAVATSGISRQFFSQLVIDVNTVPTNILFRGDDVAMLINELIAENHRLAHFGSIKALYDNA